ncbi:hypothetical protein C8Q70DRAFT_1120976 [Cubamyces menziesii]|nr:hypothetical protein C8Q70DRAFT_1120976 [Cubamyces menziesii]
MYNTQKLRWDVKIAYGRWLGLGNAPPVLHLSYSHSVTKNPPPSIGTSYDTSTKSSALILKLVLSVVAVLYLPHQALWAAGRRTRSCCKSFLPCSRTHSKTNSVLSVLGTQAKPITINAYETSVRYVSSIRLGAVVTSGVGGKRYCPYARVMWARNRRFSVHLAWYLDKLANELLAIGERVAAITRSASSLASLTALHGPLKLLVVEHDISDATKSADDLISRIVNHFGRLDVVVNNAGYGLNGVVEGTPDEAARAQLEVNFWAPVRISRAAVKYFRENNPPAQGGRILNISSTGGFSSNPTLAFYSASKFALEGFSEGLQKELDPRWNIKVTIIQPGGVRTLWAGSNMVEVPLPPAYADPESTPAKFLQVMRGTKYIGDPNKVGRALITISKADNPPMRLPLGADARFVIQNKLNEIQREFDEWKELELSTVADDADPTFLAKLSGSVVRT